MFITGDEARENDTKTRPIRPTMRPHDDERIVRLHETSLFAIKIIDFPVFPTDENARTHLKQVKGP